MISLKEMLAGKKVIVFGTGVTCDAYLSYCPISVDYFVDNDTIKWGSDYEGKKILNPEVLLKENKNEVIIFIVSFYYYQVIAEQLLGFGFVENNHFYSIKMLNHGQMFFPGHYYSPIPSIEEVKLNSNEIFNRSSKNLKGIELNEYEQLKLLEGFSSFYHELPYDDDNKRDNRFHFQNNFFEHSDAIMLYSMIRYQKPKRIIEVGSGLSSALMMDTNDLFFDGKIKLTFIEPYPDRLKSLFRMNDEMNVELIQKRVQEVDSSIFQELDKGDILFIDSSHISKIGSDVNHLIFEILPLLRKGVFVHFHDILWPFEYQESWVYEGRSWNEAYLLRAFLQYNSAFKIKLWTNFLGRFNEEKIFKLMPLCLKDLGGSIWLEKTETSS